MRFNNLYGPVFTVPEPMIPPVGARIMGLQDPTAKMSKSDDAETNAVYLLDPPDVIARKIKRAVTDLGNEVRYDAAEKPGVVQPDVDPGGDHRRSLRRRSSSEFNGKGYGKFKQAVGRRGGRDA